MLFGDPSIEFRREMPSGIYAPIEKLSQNKYRFKFLASNTLNVAAVDYYTGKNWTMSPNEIIETENPGFTEVCIHAPKAMPLKRIVDKSTDVIIKESVNQNSSYSANRLLIGNAFYYGNAPAVILSSEKIDASVKELIVLPGSEISESCDFSIIID